MTNKTDTLSKLGKELTADPAIPNPKALRVIKMDGKSQAALFAGLVTEPSVTAMLTVAAFSATGIFKDVGVTELADELRSQIDATRAGSLGRAEGMLIAQAHSLQAIFTEMARRAALNMGEHLEATDTYMKLALRAQSQCRATLETLATIKNPPNVAFVKQANIAHGPQQVNNGVACEPTRAEEKANPPTELLEHDHAQRLDTGTASTASAGDPIMATVGTIDRATHRTRKSRSKP